MAHNDKDIADKEACFLEVLNRNRQLIMKVCYMYAADDDQYKDLYQEVVINMWQGLDKFRGECQQSTWIYRIALNTCVTFYRRNAKYSGNVSIDSACNVGVEDSSRIEDLKLMYTLISRLSPIEKAIILMWLDEKGYDEISSVTGLSRANVASRLHRIKLKLIKEGNK